jgi:hypothetical protein
MRAHLPGAGAVTAGIAFVARIQFGCAGGSRYRGGEHWSALLFIWRPAAGNPIRTPGVPEMNWGLMRGQALP